MRRSRGAAITACAVALAAALAASPVAAQVELSVDGSNARLLTARDGVIPPARTVILGGIGATVFAAPRRLELAARVRRSTLDNDLSFGEVAVARRIGEFAPQLAFAWRSGYDAGSGELHGATHTFARLGVAWRRPLVATPLTLAARFGIDLPLEGGALPGGSVRGWEGESALRATLGRMPGDLRFAFRFERFAVDRAVQETTELSLGFVWRGSRR